MAFLPLSAWAGGLSLLPSMPTGQPVGTTIVWTVVGETPVQQDFQLMVSRAGGLRRTLYAYSAKRQFDWTPMDDGLYTVIALARDRTTGLNRQVLAVQYMVTSLATTSPVVSPTRHPLVALYSGPVCPADNFVSVTFFAQGSTGPVNTPRKRCDGIRSMNFLIGGMRAETQYAMQQSNFDAAGNLLSQGPVMLHTTGAITATLPVAQVRVPATAEADTTVPFLLAAPTPGLGVLEFAVDTDGEYVWYYDNPHQEAESDAFMLRMIAGGTFMVIIPDTVERYRMREIDLAGNTRRETTARRLNQQYIALGGTTTVTVIHHEARILDNGQTIVLAGTESIFTDVQDPGGDVNIVGDIILGLDANWNVIWHWNAYDHLDLSREATLGETCFEGEAGCPILYLTEPANDWTHSNSVAYSPADGNLIFSMRHQDWVAKIDYQDATGTGALLWLLGAEGDFTPISSDLNPWFSHQHDANYLGDNVITLFDNNVLHPDCIADPLQCYSRGQVWQIDEDAMTAELTMNVHVDAFAVAIGSAQPLSNGNLATNAGFRDVGPLSTADEMTPAGDMAFSVEVLDAPLYRSFRVRDLYSPPVRDFP